MLHVSSYLKTATVVSALLGVSSEPTVLLELEKVFESLGVQGLVFHQPTGSIWRVLA